MKNTLEFGICLFIGLLFSLFACLKLLISVALFGKKALIGPKFRSRPKILTEKKYGKSGFLHLKDITMHYVENGDPSKPLLLLLHGFPEFWFSWRHQLTSSKLVQHFRVVAVDLRGYGDTDKPSGVQQYRMQLVVEDLRQAIRALGYSSCHVVGHDWGGVAAWWLATWQPQCVRRLAILNCPHPAASRLYTRSHWSQFLRSWYLFFFQLPWLPEWLIGRQDLATVEESLTGKSLGVRRGRITAEELEAYKFALGEPGALSGPVNYHRACLRHPPPGDEAVTPATKGGGGGGRGGGGGGGGVRTVESPVLMIFGSRDRLVCEEAARLSQRYCRSFEMRSLPESSHWVQQDSPEQVNSLLGEFFTAGRQT